jgi:hypothetical protein
MLPKAYQHHSLLPVDQSFNTSSNGTSIQRPIRQVATSTSTWRHNISLHINRTSFYSEMLKPSSIDEFKMIPSSMFLDIPSYSTFDSVPTVLLLCPNPFCFRICSFLHLKLVRKLQFDNNALNSCTYPSTSCLHHLTHIHISIILITFIYMASTNINTLEYWSYHISTVVRIYVYTL